jgi:hypothetical protein
MSCYGDGKCMTVCNTNKYCQKPHEVSNYIFCKLECENDCELMPCKNVVHCKVAYPYYFFKERNYSKNDMCNQCNIFKITFLKEKRKCLVCSVVKFMIVTKCQHEMCYDCLFELNEDNTNCPFCGTEIEVNTSN